MGLLERALAGLGKGLADSGEMNLKSQIEELRMNRLAELQEARDSRKYARERTDKLSDFERQKEWELEKMDAEYAHKARLKGISVGGRGGGGSGSGDPEDNFLRDDEGNVVRDPYTDEPVERSPSNEGSGSGRSTKGSKKGKSSGSGGDAASAYTLVPDPVTGNMVSVNKITGAGRNVTLTTPGEEYKPETLGLDDEQNLKRQNEAAKIQAAQRDNKPVSTAPGYRSNDSVRALKAEDKDSDKEREYRLKELEAYDRSKKAHDESQESLPRSKRTPFMSEEDFRKRLTGKGLIGAAMPEPKVEEPKPKVEDVAEKVSDRRESGAPRVETPQVEAPKVRTPSRSEQGQRARPAGIPSKRAFHPKTGQWLVLINGKWYPE